MLWTSGRTRTAVQVDTAPLVAAHLEGSIPPQCAPEVQVPADARQPPADPHQPQRVTVLGMTLNLVTGGLGSGILTLAWGMAGASVIVAVGTILAVVALNACTIMLLVQAAEAYKQFDLGSLLRMLPGRQLGPIAQGVCNFLVWATMWMTLVSYIIVVQDSFTSLFPAHSVLSRRWVWAVLASALVLPLTFVDLRFLSRTSSPLSVGVNCYLFGLLCVRLATDGVSADGPCLVARLDPPPTGVIAFISLMSNTIIIQMCILPMYKDLEERSPAKFRRALGVSFSLLALLYAAFATIAYLHFGPTVPDNVLNALSKGGWGDAARVGISVVVLCVYPLMVVPMLAPVEALVEHRRRRSSTGAGGECGGCGGGGGGGDGGGDCGGDGDDDHGSGVGKGVPAVKATAVGIVASVMTCTFFVSDLGLMNVIAGTVSVGGFVALAPGLVGLWLSHPPGARVGMCWRAGMHTLIWGGLVLSILGIFFRTNFVGGLAQAGGCWWAVSRHDV